jgi:hypothetical protein
MITITNKGIYKSDFGIAEIRDPLSLEVISEDEIVHHLSEEVELGESLTFEAIFDIIFENKEILEKIYKSCLGGFSLQPFINELNDIPSKKTELDYLEIFWHSDKSDNDLTIVSGLHGIGVEETETGVQPKGDIISYAIEFTPLNNLKYLKVKINKEIVTMNYDSKDDNFQLNLGRMTFTLYDLFYAILFEISWNGDPAGRENRLEELEETIKTSEEEIDNGEGKELDMEELFEMFDANDEYLVKYDELRDRVDEELSIDMDLISLKSCLKEKLKLYHEIEKSKEKDLTPYYKKLTDNDYDMQILYGLDENIKEHKFWETPKCTCPKIDNVVNYPSGDYTKDEKCPIHKKTSQI